jgi:hypothetical protein
MSHSMCLCVFVCLFVCLFVGLFWYGRFYGTSLRAAAIARFQDTVPLKVLTTYTVHRVWRGSAFPRPNGMPGFPAEAAFGDSPIQVIFVTPKSARQTPCLEQETPGRNARVLTPALACTVCLIEGPGMC